MKIQIKKLLLDGIFVIALVIFIAFLINSVLIAKTTKTSKDYSPSSKGSATGQQTRSQTVITYESLPSVLSKNSIVRDLPKNAVLLLRFYNFYTGERQWEKSYVLTTGNAKEGIADNADMTIVIHSKYLSRMTPNNFCDIIKNARANNDLGTWTELSKAQLLWKFKSMTKYRDCLGF